MKKRLPFLYFSCIMRVMKKISILIVLMFLATSAFARPIQSVELEYDFEAQMLKIEVMHKTRNKTQEFVRKIVISKNGQEVEVRYYKIQPDPDKLVVDIAIEAKEGDEFLVQAFSNEGGSKEGVLKVKKNDQKEEKANHSQAHEILAALSFNSPK